MTAGQMLERLDREECLRLLADERIGRLAIVVGGSPHVVPVNFVLDGESVVFRTGAGTKLAAAERAPACFEIDSFDPTRRSGWSVVAHGRLEEVTHLQNALYRRVTSLPVEPWAAGDKPSWMRLVPGYFTGRRVRPRPATSPANLERAPAS